MGINRRLIWATICSIIFIGLSTVLAVTYGPKPEVKGEILNQAGVRVEAFFSEPTDKFILVLWWLAAITIALIFSRRMAISSSQKSFSYNNSYSDIFLYLSGAISSIIIIVSATWTLDPTSQWEGVGLKGLFIGAAITFSIFSIWTIRNNSSTALSIVLCVVLLAFLIPAFLQFPASIRDPYHFGFTSEEFASVAGGHFPLSDYVPQYATILGFVLAPLISIWPSSVTLVIVISLLLMQLISLAFLCYFPISLGGWKMLAPALAVGVVPVFTPILDGIHSASTYFACFPIRIFFPILLIFISYRLLNSEISRKRFLISIGFLGFFAGMTALNNLDYGVPAVIAVVVTFVISSQKFVTGLLNVFVFTVGSVVSVASYFLLGFLTNNPVHPSTIFTFVNAFGAQGFMSFPMATFGMHIGFVALFVAASVSGFILIKYSQVSNSKFAFRQGILLCLAGGWSLLSLPYFVGRSLPPTALGGFAFSIGLVMAAFLPLIRLGLRKLISLGSDLQPIHVVSVAISAISITCVAGMFSLMNPPSKFFEILSSPTSNELPPLQRQNEEVLYLVNASTPDGYYAEYKKGQLAQALPMSSLTALITRVPSVAVSSSPDYLALSSVFDQIQCNTKFSQRTKFVLFTTYGADALSAESTCRKIFKFESRRDLNIGGTKYTMLELK